MALQKITYSDGTTYVGDTIIVDGVRIKHGRGKITCRDGETYDGGWRDDKRNGRGIATFPKGETYDGEWNNNAIHGYGRHTWTDGRIYDGEWRNHKKCGHGTLTEPDGTIKKGTWKDDKFISRDEAPVSSGISISPAPAAVARPQMAPAQEKKPAHVTTNPRPADNKKYECCSYSANVRYEKCGRHTYYLEVWFSCDGIYAKCEYERTTSEKIFDSNPVRDAYRAIEAAGLLSGFSIEPYKYCAGCAHAHREFFQHHNYTYAEMETCARTAYDWILRVHAILEKTRFSSTFACLADHAKVFFYPKNVY